MENVAWECFEEYELRIIFVFKKGEKQKSEEEYVIECFVICIYKLNTKYI
jgi:hypothetical protein